MNSMVKRIVAACLLLLVCYVVLTPIGALRATLLWSGFPAEALHLQVKVATAADVGLSKLDNPSNTTIYRIVSNVPHAEFTDTDLYNWIVSKHGIFYTAKYYGWC